MTRSITIVGGCGHVGLPLGIAFTLAGADVTLIDVDPHRLEEVEAGRMPFHEKGAAAALTQALATGRLRCTSKLQAIRNSQTVIITIGTPVDEFLDPSVRSFDRAMAKVLEHTKRGQLIILRSTLFPRVTERLAATVAERGLDLDIAHCPERIAQGYALEELGKLPQIIGGATPRATARAKEIFSLLGVELLELAPTEAELAKLFANSYRYINFAIANQFYLIASRFGCEYPRIHHAVTKNYPRLSGLAKAGFAGGPCLLKDTMQLAAFNHNSFLLGQAAMMVNEGLPSMLVELAKSRWDLRNMSAAILGMAFKGDNDDCRDSLAYKLRKVLLLECRAVLCTDPFIHDPEFVSLDTALAEADIVFVGANHSVYKHLILHQPVIDAFDFLAAVQPARQAA